MKKDIIVTAKSVEDAALEGAATLGVNREDVTLDVIEEPKKGFLGIGSTPAKVKVTYILKPLEAAKNFIETLLRDLGIAGEIQIHDDGNGESLITIEGEEYDYSFSIEFVSQESNDDTEVATLRTIVGEDISEYKFLIAGSTDEEALEEVAEYIASDECEECYTLNQSTEFKVTLPAGEYAIVVVLYDINGELLDEYYTQIISLTTGLENIEENGAEINFGGNNNVISVAKAGVIELLDASGRLVKRANCCTISVADLEAGIYFVKYNNKVVKIMKK